MRFRHHAVRVVAVVMLGALTACGNDSTPNALRPSGSESSTTLGVWWWLIGAATVVGLVVGALIVWGSLRSPRPNPGGLGDGAFIAVGGVALPAIVLIITAVVTVAATTMMRAGPDPDAVRVEVIGHQYWWEITYPDLDIVTANEITIPVDRPVELTLRSADVIHSFWIPELAGKQDLIPGQTNRLEIDADRPDTYWGVCAEFCGIQHAGMGIAVVALPTNDFDAWAAEHGAARAARQLTPLEQRGAEVFDAQPCGGCHTIAGTEADGTIGPDLTHLSDRLTIGAGVLDNTAENLARWITSVQDVKPGAEMREFELTDDDLDALVAYLEAPR